jgi:membrane protein
VAERRRPTPQRASGSAHERNAPDRRRDAHAGETAERPSEIPPRGWLVVLRRVWDQVDRDNMLLVAAGCAFYAMLALFPAITALVSIYGLVADPSQVQQQMSSLEGILPQQALDLISTQANSVAGGAGNILGWSAALALLFALYTASSGVRSLFTALNIAYEEHEQRGFLQLYLLALAFTLGGVLALAVGLGVIVVLPVALGYLPLGPIGGIAVRIGSWAVLLVLLLLGLAVTYRFGPSRAKPRWRWVTPGSAVAALLWGAGSLAFSWYVANFASYNETYGVLGGVIILLMWLYLSALVILLGAELNAELELQTRRDTTTGESRPMGRRKAYVADHARS